MTAFRKTKPGMKPKSKSKPSSRSIPLDLLPEHLQRAAKEAIARKKSTPPEHEAKVSARNKASQHRGQSGEDIVAVYRQAALRAGVCRIDRVATPTRFVSAIGAFSRASKSTVDGVGFMLDGSCRFVAEEVKTTPDSNIHVTKYVKKHQRDFLDHVHKAGGVAVLTIVDGSGRVHVIPWAYAGQKVYLTAEDLLAHRVTISQYMRRFLRVP